MASTSAIAPQKIIERFHSFVQVPFNALIRHQPEAGGGKGFRTIWGHEIIKDKNLANYGQSELDNMALQAGVTVEM